ncbi:iron ABC transporter substrate-binding protein [Clostridium sp. MSJ-4]|uniref:Iron ABC transporter substrate-binding protein n=1 Tax=Clostridium simiarum TaxID=2841506 RepID=A0ABS6F2V8_9CLOT|nr:iron ABC transporter substrate-binding protein [Clostridium simiarum]MBU5592646.1 iron ABC transporter substrate-binding protein [Clostridium simiarum]
MNKQKLIGITLVFAILSIYAFTSNLVSMKSTTDTSTQTSSSRIITDAYNRQVELPDNIKTIAAIGGSARILTYGGCANKLIGVTDMDKKNVPAMPYSVVNAEHFKSLTSVGSGGSNGTYYVEALVALKPDVIFGMIDEDTIKNIAEKTGIPTIAIYPTDIFDQSFYSALKLIGQVMGTEDHCTKVIEYVKSCKKDLDDRTKDIPDADKPTVYTGAVSFRGAHGFEGTYAGYPPFDVIHAKNVVDETSKSGAMLIDPEKVMIWNPDIIFLNPTNMNLVNQSYAKNKAFYNGLKAVQNGQIYTQISYNYNWTNMEIAIADAYYAGKIIYPKQFEDINPIKKADEIFNVMLGQSFYEKLAADGSKFDKITIGE